MWPLNRRFAFALLVIALSAPVALLAKRQKNSNIGSLDESKRALHALNRLTFGPRSGDLQRVAEIGVDKWIDLQLHPEKIDDSVLEAKLAPLRTLRMDTREIVENFPPPQVIRAIAEGKQPLPSDRDKRAIYQAQLDRMQQKQERKQDAQNGGGGDPNPQTGKLTGDERAQRRQERMQAEEEVDALIELPPDQRMAAIMKMPPEEQRMLARALPADERESMMSGLDARQRETLMALQNPQQVVTNELMQGKLLRAIYSERQLQEVMTDFWLNHFNVFIGKGADRYLLTSYERDVIRPHALGKFKDLLLATAKSPAMLFYLDNWMSVGPNSDFARGFPRRDKYPRPRGRFGPFGPRVGMGMPRPPWPHPSAAKKQRSGLNENYARELMELHTLSVNGGYTQRDVTEVAKIFTGWTIKQPRQGGGFEFEPRMHEPGEKWVLGHKIKEDGEKEGAQVLEMLARNPSTAKFICTKLAQRFVSDDPPASLIARMQQTFQKKNGDVAEVLRTLFHSPEFWSPEAYRAKVKTPLEFVVSSVRGTDAQVTDGTALAQALNRMGMPLYGCQPPTGYSMKSETWVNSSALLNRMNFALAFAGGHVQGTKLDHSILQADPSTDSQQLLARLEGELLHGDTSQQTHATISKQLFDPQITQRRLDDPARPPNVGAIAGLLLGSPEFQRR